MDWCIIFCQFQITEQQIRRMLNLKSVNNTNKEIIGLSSKFLFRVNWKKGNSCQNRSTGVIESKNSMAWTEVI